MKEQLDIDIQLKGESDLEDIIKDIESGLEPISYLENKILSATTKQLGKLKKTRTVINDILKARGDTRRAEIKETDSGEFGLELIDKEKKKNKESEEAIQDKTDAQNDAVKEQGKKINQDKRETRGLEHLLRRYRWAQSLFLVTQNFMGRMGESISVFGAGMSLLFAPLKLLFNVILLPALPILAAFSKWVFEVVQGFADWYLSSGGLGEAISSAAWALAMFVQTLPIAGLLVGIGDGLQTLIKGFFGIDDAAKVAGTEGESFSFKLGEAIGKVFRWIADEGPTILEKVWTFIKNKITWVIDNLPTIKQKLIGIWDYISKDVYPKLTSFLDDIVKADLPGIMESISTKGSSFIKILGDFLTKHGPLIDRILLGGGTIAKVLARVAGPIGVMMAVADLVKPAGSLESAYGEAITQPAEYVNPYQGGVDLANTVMNSSYNTNDVYNITLNSTATNSDQIYTEVVDRLKREGISKGAI